MSVRALKEEKSVIDYWYLVHWRQEESDRLGVFHHRDVKGIEKQIGHKVVPISLRSTKQEILQLFVDLFMNCPALFVHVDET